MHVLMFEKRFWEPIVLGHKVHTIRPTRKRPIYPGNPLSLRGWSGRPYRSKHSILTEETCIDCRNIWIDSAGVVIEGYDRIYEFEELDQFAQTDGFKDYHEMLEYWAPLHQLPFSGDFIQWGPNKFLESKKI